MKERYIGFVEGMIGMTIGVILGHFVFTAETCRNFAAPVSKESYSVYGTIQFNRVDSLKASEIRATLVKDFPGACLVTMAVDTLHGDTVLLGSIEDLVLSVQDTNGFVESPNTTGG